MDAINTAVTSFLTEWIWDDIAIAMAALVTCWFMLLALSLIKKILLGIEPEYDEDGFSSEDDEK